MNSLLYQAAGNVLHKVHTSIASYTSLTSRWKISRKTAWRWSVEL